MTKYESTIKELSITDEQAFDRLTDMRNLEVYKDMLPKDKVGEIIFEKDTCKMTISPIGEVVFRIVESERAKVIKFGADNLPLAFNAWIQLLPIDDISSKMKVTIKADIPFMLKAMIGKKLQEVVEMIAQGIATVMNRK